MFPFLENLSNQSYEQHMVKDIPYRYRIFLQIIQNIPIYKIRVESMEQTILLFYRYYILLYYKKNSSATKYHTNPRNARGKDTLEHTKRRIKSGKNHYYF